MDKTRRSRLGSGGAFALAGSLAASMLLWFVVPVLAVSCPDNGSLTNPQVTPDVGDDRRPNFTFSVTYQDNAGEAPTSIRVYFSDGTPDRRLNLASGNLTTGAVYSRTLTFATQRDAQLHRPGHARDAAGAPRRPARSRAARSRVRRRRRPRRRRPRRPPSPRRSRPRSRRRSRRPSRRRSRPRGRPRARRRPRGRSSTDAQADAEADARSRPRRPSRSRRRRRRRSDRVRCRQADAHVQRLGRGGRRADPDRDDRPPAPAWSPDRVTTAAAAVAADPPSSCRTWASSRARARSSPG